VDGSDDRAEGAAGVVGVRRRLHLAWTGRDFARGEPARNAGSLSGVALCGCSISGLRGERL
jgi:hypothetical protein